MDTLILPEEESKHACRVLRMQPGDQLSIINGFGDELVAQITDNNPKRCKVKKISFSHKERDDFEIHIALAPTKLNDRFEWFLEKTTELGIHRITPILCENSERSKIKTDRYERIIISALKQSQRLYLPFIDELTPFETFIKNHPNGLIAHCYEGQKFDLTKKIQSKNCPILIGPEGDFSILEVENALKTGYTPISLGKTRLRTETAGIYACALVKNELE